MLSDGKNPYIRAATLNGFEEILQGYGVNLVETLEEVGIDPKALEDPNILISFVAYNRFLNVLETKTGKTHIGLELVMTARRALDNIGPLAVILKLGDTTGECVDNALRFLRYHTNGVNIEIIRHPEVKLAEFRYTPLPPLSDVRHLSENALGLACTGMRFLVSDESRNPEKVTFQHRQPKDVRIHHDFFGCPVEFNQSYNSLFFDLELLDLETIGADSQIADVIYSYLQDEIDKVEANQSLATSVAVAIAQLLPTGRHGIEVVSKAVALHPKSIQRKLKEEGTTFSKILEQVRRDSATRLLTETEIPAASVSALCGYSNPAAFNLAFRKWFEVTPGEFRQAPRDVLQGGESHESP